MLLTTLALVHRKIGRLPQRRVELYREALQVLLNWRGEIDERLDWEEAVPQLEYVAYAMCHAGVQQLPKDGVLELLEEMREQSSSSQGDWDPQGMSRGGRKSAAARIDREPERR